MRTVHKFPFSPDPAQTLDGITIDVGYPSSVLHVGIDPAGNGFVPCLWVEHDPTSTQRDERQFRFIGTGHPVPDRGTFVGSVVTPHSLVWHVYEMNRTIGP